MPTGTDVGFTAVGFSLKDTERNERKLSEFYGRTVLLAFFPGAFTSVCQKEACRFRDDIGKLKDLGAQVVGVTVDSPFANKGFSQHNNLPFPLLSDYNREVVKSYGIELKDFAGLKGYTAAKRSVFLLDKKGVIRFRWVSDDPGVEPDYNAVTSAISKLK